MQFAISIIEITDKILDVGDILLYCNLVAAIAATLINIWSYIYYDNGPYRFLKAFRASIACAYIVIFIYRINSHIVVGRSQYIGLGVALASWVCVFILPSLIPPLKAGTRLVVEVIERIKREEDI